MAVGDPWIGGLSPAQAAPGSVEVEVHGRNFAEGAVVTAGLDEVDTTYVDDTMLVASLEAPPAGSVMVRVLNPDGGSSNVAWFTSAPWVPKIAARQGAMTESGAFDPTQHTAAEVLAYVDGHPDQAGSVLAAERSGKARVTVISTLQDRIG